MTTVIAVQESPKSWTASIEGKLGFYQTVAQIHKTCKKVYGNDYTLYSACGTKL